MPTGYTADIKDGISFEQFVLNCAKAFGACISMRDLPSDAPIPEEFEPSSYHAEKLTEARIALSIYENISEDDAAREARNEYAEAELSRTRRLQENLNQLESYRGMLEQAWMWSAPSEEHDGLKEFMIKQITESIEWDDSTKYLSTPTPVVSVTDWLEAKKAAALKDIEYHKEKNAEELQLTAGRNRWVRQLRESLK